MKNIVADFLKKLRVVLYEAVSSFQKNNDLTLASSLAFSATLALIPALFLLTFFLGIAVGSSAQALVKTQEMVEQLIPTYSREILREVRFITAHKGAIGLLNLLLLVWTITPLVSEMRVALGAIFKKRPGRPYVLEKLLDVSITVLFLIGLTTVAVAGVAFTLLRRFTPLRVPTEYLGSVVPFLFVTGVVLILYVIFSTRVRILHLLIGALATSLLWFLMRPAFHLFLTYNPGYGFTFGSFKSLFVVIIWIYYSLSVFLFGAEIAASLDRKDAVFVKRLMEGKGRTVPETVMRRFVVAYAKGSVIFSEGDEGKEMYSVLRGSVVISRAGREIAVVREGKFFGEMAFLLSMPRSASAAALDDVELVTVSSRTIGSLMNEFPEFVLEMLREMALRLRETDRLIE